MAWVRRTMIVADAVVDQCRAMAAQLALAGGSDMWTRPLSANGSLPATHWISAGCIDESFAAMISSPEALSAGAGIPLEQATAILSQCIVSDDDPHAAMAAAGLVMVSAEVQI